MLKKMLFGLGLGTAAALAVAFYATAQNPATGQPLQALVGDDAPKTIVKPILKAHTGLVVSAPADASDVTVYGSSFAQVQETRKVVNVPAGHARIQLNGIAAKYRADSLRLISVDGPGQFTYRSATYQPANFTAEQLLTHFIGKEITAKRRVGDNLELITGTLQSANGSQLVLSIGGRPELVNTSDVSLPYTPEGLSNTAALVIEAEVATAGTYTIDFQYASDGFSWSAKHSLIYDEDNNKLNSWATNVSVFNDSGTSFKNATLRLISGKVAANVEDAPGGGLYRMSAAPAMVGSSGAAVESVGDQNVFVIPGTVTLNGGQSRQIPLFDASTYGKDVPVKKVYVVGTNWTRYGYNSTSGSPLQQAGIRLTVENCEKHNLGKALPAGTVEVQQRKSGKTLQLTGSARIGEKAQDEIFDLNIATSSDVKWEVKLVSNKQVTGTPAGDDEEAAAPPAAAPVIGRTQGIAPTALFEEREYELTVTNYKRDKAVDVKVEINGTLKQLPTGWKKLGADKSEANVSVAKSDKTTVKFTLRTQINR